MSKKPPIIKGSQNKPVKAPVKIADKIKIEKNKNKTGV